MRLYGKLFDSSTTDRDTLFSYNNINRIGKDAAESNNDATRKCTSHF